MTDKTSGCVDEEKKGIIGLRIGGDLCETGGRGGVGLHRSAAAHREACGFLKAWKSHHRRKRQEMSVLSTHQGGRVSTKERQKAVWERQEGDYSRKSEKRYHFEGENPVLGNGANELGRRKGKFS